MAKQQIRDAFLKHYGSWNDNGRDYNMFTSGWLEARATERARCAAIVEPYTDDSHPGPVQFAARRMLAAIEG